MKVVYLPTLPPGFFNPRIFSFTGSLISLKNDGNLVDGETKGIWENIFIEEPRTGTNSDLPDIGALKPEDFQAMPKTIELEGCQPVSIQALRGRYLLQAFPRKTLELLHSVIDKSRRGLLKQNCNRRNCDLA
ncbi:hypothetical protein ACFX1X_037254 [Malus domestica]